MKKITLLTLVLVFVFSLTACANAKPTQLGTSAFSIVFPKGYASVEDEFEDDQVAYFFKDDDSVDVDVYQWKKGDEFTLASEATAFATAYGTTATAITVNGIDCMKYVSLEDYEGETYTVINYMFEDDTYIVEICFWTVGTEEETAAVEKIINTLKKN